MLPKLGDAVASMAVSVPTQVRLVRALASEMILSLRSR